MSLNQQQIEQCESNNTDFSDLNALFLGVSRLLDAIHNGRRDVDAGHVVGHKACVPWAIEWCDSGHQIYLPKQITLIKGL